MLLFSTITAIIPPVSAAGDDAEFNSIELSATPRVQGIDGEITIRAKANFFGGCCYHLYAYDVIAELVLPDEVELLSDIPGTIDMVDAQPGGQATSVSFSWTVKSSIPGVYDLNVEVRTSNSGSQSDIVTITIIEGASVSNFNLYPNEPSIKEEISVNVEVKSGSDEIQIEQTDLYFFTSDREFDFDKIIAENEILYLDESTDDNASEPDLKIIGTGEVIPMSPDLISNKWRSKLSGFSDETEVYMWFVVKTSDNLNTTSSVYHILIQDLERRELILSSVIWMTIIGVILGSILIIGGWIFISGRTENIRSNKGFMSLGSRFREEPYKPDTPQAIELQQRREKTRYVIIIFLVIIALALIIWAVYAGLFTELFNRTVEG
jgi:hypothetical protein